MKHAILALAVSFGVISSAHAETFMVQATVTRVDTNSFMEQIRVPQRECQIVEVPVYGEGRQDTGGAIVGGIIGGVIGNQIGKGSGNDVATGVGAITGAIIGGKGRNEIVGYRQVEQCNTTHKIEYRERIKNYSVHWDWNGYKGQFYTQRPMTVGETFTLNLSLNPR